MSLKRKVEIVGERGAELSPKQNDITLLQELDTPSYCGRSDLRQFKEHAPVAWLAVGAMDGCVEGKSTSHWVDWECLHRLFSQTGSGPL